LLSRECPRNILEKILQDESSFRANEVKYMENARDYKNVSRLLQQVTRGTIRNKEIESGKNGIVVKSLERCHAKPTASRSNPIILSDNPSKFIDAT
jgi:hypothetical protein